MIAFTFIGLSFGVLAGATRASAASQEPVDAPIIQYENILRCGPNAAAIFIMLENGSIVDLPDFQDIPIDATGSSMLALRDVIERAGIPVEIRRYPPEKIANIPLPAIALFATSENNIGNLHFDVIYKADSSRIYAVNGTTGGLMKMTRYRRPNESGSTAQSLWTGYALVPKRSFARNIADARPLLTWSVGGFSVTLASLLAATYVFRARRA